MGTRKPGIRVSKSEPNVDQNAVHSVLQANTQSRFPIIKRRIAHLLGQIVYDGAISSRQPDAWNILIHLLKDDSSEAALVARLTAAVSIQKCVVVC